MLWLTWRQHRIQALVTVVLIAGVWVILALDEMPMDLVKILPWAPVLVGLFWGVPLLSREYERGTHRLAWAQSVLPARWLAVKFAVLGVAVTIAGLALGLAVRQWSDVQGSRVDPYGGDLFGVTGIASGAWFLVVFALGAASGAALRRLLPAMAVTIAVFAVLVVGSFLARPYYAEPLEVTDGPIPAGSMVAELGVENAGGARLSWDEAWRVCDPVEPVGCMEKRGYTHQYTLYHPPERFWRFQWTETGVLVLLAIGLGGLTLRRVTHRTH